MRILLVEDEPSAARFIAKGLREATYAVDIAVDGNAAAEQCQQYDYDAIVLDVMLPGRDGLSVCREIRAAGSDVPVLMLTARDAVEARVQGLDAGADDYLTKPFDFRELLARLRALTRRERRPLAPERIEVGGLTIDVPGRRVFRQGHEIALTSREYALLEIFMQNPGRILTRTLISEKIWASHYDVDTNLLDVYMSRLRAKLETTPGKPLFKTIRGVGYQLL